MEKIQETQTTDKNLQKCLALANDMKNIKDMMLMLNSHIEKDSESLNKISENIDHTDANLEDANKKLIECSEIKQNVNFQKMIFYAYIFPD